MRIETGDFYGNHDVVTISKRQYEQMVGVRLVKKEINTSKIREKVAYIMQGVPLGLMLVTCIEGISNIQKGIQWQDSGELFKLGLFIVVNGYSVWLGNEYQKAVRLHRDQTNRLRAKYNTLMKI